MREVPLLDRLVRAIPGFPPAENAAPRMKSICPPTPEMILLPTESAQTCPVRSSITAELTATTRGFLAMVLGELT